MHRQRQHHHGLVLARLGRVLQVLLLLAASCVSMYCTLRSNFTVQQGIRYGPGAAQIGDLLLPEGASEPGSGAGSRGVVMLVHGGFWQGTYDRSLMADLAVDLASRGLTVWNPDYRSLGTLGGYPETLNDVALALDWLASDAARSSGVEVARTAPAAGSESEVSDNGSAPTLPLAIVGHSAGGHLATWLGLRALVPNDVVPGPAGPVSGLRPCVVVSQSGVVDFSKAYVEGLGAGAVRSFMDTSPGDEELRWKAFRAGELMEPFSTPAKDADARYRVADPVALASAAPAGALGSSEAPLLALVHGREDSIVPVSQSRSLADVYCNAGAASKVCLRVVDGEAHFEHLKPASKSWQAALQVVSQAFGVPL